MQLSEKLGVFVLLIYLDHLRHIALRPGVLCGIFHFYKHNKEKVVPHIVLLFDVLLKSHCLVVELVPFKACREGNEVQFYAEELQ